MKFINKSILIVSPEPWDHIFVSKHHYATHLASLGNKIYFLNPPADNEECKETIYDNLYSVSYRGFIKGLRFLPTFIQRTVFRKVFDKLQELCNTKFDIVWSFDNSVFFDFKALPDSVYSISHIVDWTQDFEFKKASLTADLCLSTSKYILEKQKKYNLKSYNIGHGFNEINNNLKTFPLKGNNKVNCGYAGNLDIKYIDWQIVEKLIKHNPNVDFHFAGQWKNKDRFTNISLEENFHFYGKLDANDLPSFYGEMDLLLLVYQYEKYPEQLANPHKVMEYLASGKMIISNWLEEYSALHGHLISMSKNASDLIECFNKVTSDFDFWNSAKKMAQRKEIAMKSNYMNKIKEIELFI